MNTIRPCGCKGCRTCLLCENQFGIEKKDFFEDYKNRKSYVFCPDCNCLYPGWDVDRSNNHNNQHDSKKGIPFPGVLVKKNYLTEEEGTIVMKKLDEIVWEGSQSGRRKQNFGPKTNFKKKKLQNGNFNGFPKFTKFIQERFESVPILKNFQTIEQCSLEYDPNKGASIDPHIDDCWIWGERIVTVNCQGDAVLSLTTFKDTKNKKYNLDLVDLYQDKLITNLFENDYLNEFDNAVIRIPMPNLSLIVLYGPPRYQFEHSVLREDIPKRRVCLAYREFTPMYLENGEHYDKGHIVIESAKNFCDYK